MDSVLNLAEELLPLFCCKRFSSDEFLLKTITDKVCFYIMNACNINYVPTELTRSAALSALGEFLQLKKGSGHIDFDSIDMESAVKSLNIGDTSVTLGSNAGKKSNEQRFDETVTAMLHSLDESQLARFRKLIW